MFLLFPAISASSLLKWFTRASDLCLYNDYSPAYSLFGFVCLLLDCLPVYRTLLVNDYSSLYCLSPAHHHPFVTLMIVRHSVNVFFFHPWPPPYSSKLLLTRGGHSPRSAQCSLECCWRGRPAEIHWRSIEYCTAETEKGRRGKGEEENILTNWIFRFEKFSVWFLLRIRTEVLWMCI